MRILTITQHFPPIVNGYAIQCAETVRILGECGHLVKVLTSHNPNALEIKSAHDNISRGLTYSPSEGYKSFNPIYLFRQVERANIFRRNIKVTLEVINDFSPDIIYIWQVDCIGIGMISAIQKLGIPLIVNIGDIIFCDLLNLLKNDKNVIWRTFRRFLYNVNVSELVVPHLIVVSKVMKQYYLINGFSELDISVLPNGIDARYIVENPPASGEGDRLLYAGRIHPDKGVDIAINAIEELNNNSKCNYTLDIIGTGSPEYSLELHNLVMRKNLQNSVRFLGPLDRETLMDKYQDYDLLVFPSIYLEPFGLTIIEAMARGVPVVASNRGGPQEIITHMRDGVLFQPGSVPGLAKAIQTLYCDSGLRYKMAQLAINKIQQKFTLQKIVSLMEPLLQHEIQKKNS